MGTPETRAGPPPCQAVARPPDTTGAGARLKPAAAVSRERRACMAWVVPVPPPRTSRRGWHAGISVTGGANLNRQAPVCGSFASIRHACAPYNLLHALGPSPARAAPLAAHRSPGRRAADRDGPGPVVVGADDGRGAGQGRGRTGGQRLHRRPALREPAAHRGGGAARRVGRPRHRALAPRRGPARCTRAGATADPDARCVALANRRRAPADAAAAAAWRTGLGLGPALGGAVPVGAFQRWRVARAAAGASAAGGPARAAQ